MDLITILGIALGLSLDIFAVSVASGFTFQQFRVHHALRMALIFGGFQMLMPVIGWLAGRSISSYISEYDHWVAFALLAFIGGKMVYESFQLEDDKKGQDPFRLVVLLVLAVATSIDALAVGLTFAFLKSSIALPVLVIGAVTFVLSFAGVYLGRKVGHLFERKIELVGGLVLVGIGVKILAEHLME
jgi:putative Mn2+ efflux pump MntP